MSKFTCNNCNKCFKTTQHLNQHKNRKKPCVAVNKDIASSSDSTVVVSKSGTKNSSSLNSNVTSNLLDSNVIISNKDDSILNQSNGPRYELDDMMNSIILLNREKQELLKLIDGYRVQVSELQFNNNSLYNKIQFVKDIFENFSSFFEDLVNLSNDMNKYESSFKFKFKNPGKSQRKEAYDKFEENSVLFNSIRASNKYSRKNFCDGSVDNTISSLTNNSYGYGNSSNSTNSSDNGKNNEKLLEKMETIFDGGYNYSYKPAKE